MPLQPQPRRSPPAPLLVFLAGIRALANQQLAGMWLLSAQRAPGSLSPSADRIAKPAAGQGPHGL